MKLLITTIALAISLTACGLFTFSEDVITPVAETQTITGTVIENNQQASVDGNNFLVVETETDVISVLYLQGGRVLSEYSGQQCNTNELVADFAQSIQVGDAIEVYGATHDLYTMEVCSNTDFYITVLETDSPAPDDTTRQVTGNIIDFINECPVDGICAYVIETDAGEEITVIWVEGDSPNCSNDPFGISDTDIFGAEDNRIEAFGTVVDDNTISVCGDNSYYISFVEADTTPDTDAQVPRQVSGEIIEIIGDCAFDGNCAYVVETAEGEEVTVIWAEGMSPICQNDPFNGLGNNDIDLGDTIDSLGRVIDATTTSACGDESYYIVKM
ncbi:MAG: hypothetical protein Phog2KO_45620 [Phototrophicaceae bacterium]